MQFVYYTEHIQLAAIPQHRSGLAQWMARMCALKMYDLVQTSAHPKNAET